jgi:hypothetical protein
MSRLWTRAARVAALAALAGMAALLGGCGGASSPGPTAAQSSDRGDAAAGLNAVLGYVDAAGWAGAVGSTSKDSPANPDASAADYDGTQTILLSAGPHVLSTTTTVSVQGALGAATASEWVHTASADLASVVDLLHLSADQAHDYLLLGSGYGAIAPTQWALSPASAMQTGADCTAPGRQLLCHLIAAAQSTAKALPAGRYAESTKDATDPAGVRTTTVSTFVQLSALLALPEWRLAPDATAALTPPTAATSLLPLTLTYVDADPADPLAKGRPQSIEASGQVDLAGAPLAIDLRWTEAPSAEAPLPAAPARPLYTVLTLDQYTQLLAAEKAPV